MRPLRTLIAAVATLAIGIPFAACGPQQDEFTETPPAEEMPGRPDTYEHPPGQYQQNGGMTQPQNGGMQSPQQQQPQQQNGGLQQQPNNQQQQSF